MPRLLPILAAALLVAAAPAPIFMPESPEVVARFVEHMRENIELGTDADGKPLVRETAAERAQPILPVALTEKIWNRGVLSGHAEACGGDWRAMSFDPLMAELRAGGTLTSRQLGFAALLHGAAQEQGKNIPEDECTPTLKARIGAALKALNVGRS